MQRPNTISESPTTTGKASHRTTPKRRSGTARPAKSRRNAAAQFDLGDSYYNGQGVPQDYAEAVKWYRMAAEQGNAAAQYDLGVAYHNGQGVPQNYAEAVKWNRMAAEQGNAAAQYDLGVAYYNGQGVPQDYAEAVKWNRMAAERGNAAAQYDLGNRLPQRAGSLPGLFAFLLLAFIVRIREVVKFSISE